MVAFSRNEGCTLFLEGIPFMSVLLARMACNISGHLSSDCLETRRMLNSYKDIFSNYLNRVASANNAIMLPNQ